MFNKIKNYIIAFGGALIGILFLGLKYLNYKNEKLKTELQNEKAKAEAKSQDIATKVLEDENKQDVEALQNKIDKFNERGKDVKKDDVNNYTSVTV